MPESESSLQDLTSAPTSPAREWASGEEHNASIVPIGLLIESPRGPLMAMYYPPAPGVAPIGDLLVAPPFAEEMNRCRAMVSLQARRLAAIGAGTLLVDLFGTGDSAGEFVEATWAAWRDDLALGIEWLERHGQGCVALWGIRLGALMATELLRAHPQVRRMLLWQPVFDSKGYYTQFLRIRIAAEMNLPDRIKSTSELRQKSAAGEPIEVSGYELGPALAAELDALDLDRTVFEGLVGTDWFEVQNDGEARVAVSTQKLVDTLRDAGAALEFERSIGPPFWHVHERELAPALIEATVRHVAAWGSGRARDAMSLPASLSGTPDAAEQPLLLRCDGDRLSGVLHRAQSTKRAQRGVVIVVAGGPQYRAGAHRQFVQMARKLAAGGWPVLRFDLRGMGDSSGRYLGFEHSVPDLRAAVDALVEREPQLDEVVLIGECESASGILFYAFRDFRVRGAVLVNPWLRTEEGRAQVIVKTYYLDRLRQAEFWRKLASGKISVRTSLVSMLDVVCAYVRGRRMFARSIAHDASDDISALPLPERVATGLARFSGQSLLLMSGHDYIAREFDEVVALSPAWQRLLQLQRVKRLDIEGADHTFSKKVWKSAASDAVVAWMRRW